jgi:broad specificity phosphatase PhoE
VIDSICLTDHHLEKDQAAVERIHRLLLWLEEQCRAGGHREVAIIAHHGLFRAVLRLDYQTGEVRKFRLENGRLVLLNKL